MGESGEQRPVTRRRRRWRIWLTGLAVAVVGFEVALRVIWGLGNPLLYEADPEIGYVLRANQRIGRFGSRVEINRFHQRNGPILPRPADGVIRVLLVGDSVAFGGTLTDQDETISSILEQRLNRSDMARWEVLNASAGSWGIGNALAYLSRFGTFGSRIVILQIGTADLTQRKSRDDAVGSRNKPDSRPITAIGELMRRYLIPRMRRSTQNVVKGANEADSSETFHNNLRDLTLAVETIRAADERTIIFVLHTTLKSEVLIDPVQFDPVFQARRQTFLKLCGELNCRVVNLAERWKSRAESDQWYRDGVHFNPRGNEVAASELAPSLIAALRDNQESRDEKAAGRSTVGKSPDAGE